MVPSTHSVVRLAELGRVLWRYRRLLDDLQRQLELVNLLVSFGSEHLVARVAGEIEVTTASISTTDAQRARLIARLAPSLGLPREASLADLAAVVAEPWNVILGDHAAALAPLVAGVSQRAASAREAGGCRPEPTLV